MISRFVTTASAAFLLAALSACGGDVEATGAGGHATSGTGATSSDATTGTTSSTTTATTTGAGGATSSSVTTGTGGAPACSACAMNGTTCCGDSCKNLDNDLQNCGTCGHVCAGEHPFCQFGVCGVAPCDSPAPACKSGFCCGATCCADGQLCCEVPGPGPTTGPKCIDAAANGGTCPIGCPLCK